VVVMVVVGGDGKSGSLARDLNHIRHCVMLAPKDASMMLSVSTDSHPLLPPPGPLLIRSAQL